MSRIMSFRKLCQRCVTLFASCSLNNNNHPLSIIKEINASQICLLTAVQFNSTTEREYGMVPRAMYDDSLEKSIWNLLIYVLFIIISPIVLFIAIFIPDISLSIVRRICYIQFESV